MLLDSFWEIVDSMISLNHYSGMLNTKHIHKKPDNKNFYSIVEFFYVVIKAIIITFCMYIARYSTIDKLKNSISRFD